jgi:hypothetical protein
VTVGRWWGLIRKRGAAWWGIRGDAEGGGRRGVACIRRRRLATSTPGTYEHAVSKLKGVCLHLHLGHVSLNCELYREQILPDNVILCQVIGGLTLCISCGRVRLEVYETFAYIDVTILRCEMQWGISSGVRHINRHT